jgi:hypothetical protein
LGVEVFREMRLEFDIPVIMITSRVNEVDRVVGLERRERLQTRTRRGCASHRARLTRIAGEVRRRPERRARSPSRQHPREHVR